MNSIGNLALVDLSFEGDVEAPVTAEHAHAVLCSWIDHDQHSAPRKPFTLRRVSTGEDGVNLQLSTVTLEALIDLQLALVDDPPVRFGRSRLRVGSAMLTRNVRWEELLDEARPVSGIDLHLESPTVFRSRSQISVMPTPGLVFGHLRAVWQHWAPADLQPCIDLSTVHIHVDRLAGRTDEVVARGRTWRGFVGTVGFDLSQATPRDRQVLSALALLAPFAGVGANTTVGMGTASVEMRSEQHAPKALNQRPSRRKGGSK
jgi:CRISPR-associated endoribonuclease Cas6